MTVQHGNNNLFQVLEGHKARMHAAWPDRAMRTGSLPSTLLTSERLR